MLSAYTNAGRAYNTVKVDVPSETWEGDKVTLTCTFTTSYSYWEWDWYNGSEPNLIYYCNSEADSQAFNDRCTGHLDGKVHRLSISPTIVADENTYICKVATETGSADLTVNGESSTKH